LLGIAAGPDGSLWFTEQNADKIGKISPSSGTVTEYVIPIAKVAPNEIAAGPDGNLWFSQTGVSKIGKISPVTGKITEYNIPNN
jgi:virginiamycin B lyase